MYLTGEIFDEDPWNRLGENALCRLNKNGLRRHRSSTSPSSALIRGLLEVDPNERMTLDEAWEHPWCRRYALSLHRIPSNCSFMHAERVNWPAKALRCSRTRSRSLFVITATWTSRRRISRDSPLPLFDALHRSLTPPQRRHGRRHALRLAPVSVHAIAHALRACPFADLPSTSLPPLSSTITLLLPVLTFTSFPFRL